MAEKSAEDIAAKAAADKAAAEKASADKAKQGTPITYKPGREDPPEVLWNGHRFRANVPLPVKDQRMVELAKGNPHFEVEGHVKPERSAGGSVPKTAEEYRAHAVKWFGKAKTAQEFEQRWQSEGPLRDRAGVGTDDIEWLSSIGDPILAELRKQAAADNSDAHGDEA